MVVSEKRELNFRLRIDPGCSIFTAPALEVPPFAEFLLWQIQQN